jgi:hypothetical protein
MKKSILLALTAKNYGYSHVEDFISFINRLTSKKTTIYLANGETQSVGELLAA